MSGQARTAAYITLLVGGNESHPCCPERANQIQMVEDSPGPTDWQRLLNDSLKRSFWAQPDTAEQLGTHKSMLTPRILTSMLVKGSFWESEYYVGIFILKEVINFFQK